jgi:TonB-dependent SusC/RagA subfamily outer membrane receptor
MALKKKENNIKLPKSIHMKIKIILLLLLAVFSINNLNAQKNNKKIIITGTVLSADKAPIANAIIMIDDVKTNYLTDSEGKYKIKVKPTASKICIFTFGNGTFEDSIKGRTQIDFNFGTSANPQSVGATVAPGEQGVNTGYGTVKEKNLTTTVNRIDGSDKKYASYASIYDMIRRRDASVKISGSTAVIQGSSDLFGSVSALIVVDGVAMDEIPDIPPISVKSIEILKGTAAAIYGSRGYGGAIIIKTKLQNN